MYSPDTETKRRLGKKKLKLNNTENLNVRKLLNKENILEMSIGDITAKLNMESYFERI